MAQKEKREQDNFYVVGVGASAGGLEALQDYFKNVPDNTGAAYVVIQHLSPDYKSLMDELLSRCTGMPVKVAEDGIEVKKNHVYLIPGSLLAGASLLLLGDLFARTVVSPVILPIGAITSFLGAPLFLYLLFKGGKQKC